MADFILEEFDTTVTTPLCSIMAHHGSDKSDTIDGYWHGHNYTTLYYSLFQSIKDNNLRIFELGLGTNNEDIISNMTKNGKPGASLRGWKQFFQNSKVFGADIDDRILFNEERINTYYCDQTNVGSIIKLWNYYPELQEDFDIIIDDGLHVFSANQCFFENSIHKLKAGGTYIIEDISNYCVKDYINQIPIWKVNYPLLSFCFIQIPHSINTNDNRVLIIRKPHPT